MGSLQESTRGGPLPIRNSNGARVCSLAGISVAKDSLVDLSKVKAGLDLAIRDLDAQSQRDRDLGRIIMVLQWTKLTCDAFIGMAAALSPGGKKINPAKVVKAAYGVTDVIADTTTKAVLGQKVNYGTAAIEAAKKGVSALPVSKEAKYLTKSSLIKAEIVVHVLSSNPKEIIKSAVEYQYELLKFSLDALELKKTLGFTELAKETFTYHQKIAALIDTTLRESESTQLSYVTQRLTLTSLARRIGRQIERLQEFVVECESELEVTPVVVLP
jgi:hypothetical protein